MTDSSMTQSAALPAMVPTKEQWGRAITELRCAYNEASTGLSLNNSQNLNWAYGHFEKVASALGLHVSAQPPAQQPQSDLVRRLRSFAFWIEDKYHVYEAADRIEALEAAAAQPSQREAALTELHIVFDGPPGHQSGRFVEVETPEGKSVNAGEWHERTDGLWELHLNGLFFVQSSLGSDIATDGRQAARGGGEVAEKALGTSPTLREAALVKAARGVLRNESYAVLRLREAVFAYDTPAKDERPPSGRGSEAP